MLSHIRRRHDSRWATRQRADLAGSLRDGAYLRQGRVEKALCGACHTAPSSPNPDANTPRQTHN